MADELSWPAVMAWRVARQGLAARAPAEQWSEIVRRLCGLHAQVASAAELTLWARVDDLPPGTLEAALWEERSLVRTWAMRGTLHLLDAADLGLDGEPLTREELGDAVAARLGSERLGEAVRGSFGTIPKLAAHRGDVCFAPPRGRQVRFTRPNVWLGGFAAVAPREAMAEVIRRYVAVYGPATRETFARWFGMPSAAQAGPGRRALHAAGWLSPVLLVDGRIAGVWRHALKGGRLTVVVESFDDLDDAVRDRTEGEAERLARYLGGELDLLFAPLGS